MKPKMQSFSASWRAWQPGLAINDHRQLEDVYRTLPGQKPEGIPLIVRFYENPESRFAFPGAISLERHDVLHIVLGRGLLNQDEAVVIGLTMGAASTITDRHAMEYQRIVSSPIYPETFRMKKQDLIAYRLAYDYARANRRLHRDLHLIPFENMMDRTIADLREEFGVNVRDLWLLFQSEKMLIPGSESSERLRLRRSISHRRLRGRHHLTTYIRPHQLAPQPKREPTESYEHQNDYWRWEDDGGRCLD